MLSKNLTRILPLQSAVASGSVSAALARVYSSAPTKSKKAPVFPEKSWPSGVDPAFDVAQNTTGHITWKNSAFAKLGLYDAPELPIEEKQAMEEKANAKAKAEEQSRNGNRAADGADRKKGKSFDFLEIGDDLMDLVREFQKDNQKTLAESASEKAAKKAAASSTVDHKSLAYPQFLFRPTDADFASDSVVTAQLREHRGGSTEDVEEWEEITQNLSICPMTGRHLSELTPAELRRVEIYDHEFIRHQSIMRYRLFGAYSRFIFEKFPQRAHEERLKRHTADIQTSAPVNINYLLPPRARSEEYRYRGKPLQCDLSQPGAIVDYKNTKLLARYLSEEGRILPRRKTGLSAKMQRQVTNAIKRARQCHLIPYTGKPWRAYPENSFNHQMGRMSEHEVYTTGDQTRSKYMDLRDAMRQKEAQLKLDNAKSTAKSNLGWV